MKPNVMRNAPKEGTGTTRNGIECKRFQLRERLEINETWLYCHSRSESKLTSLDSILLKQIPGKRVSSEQVVNGKGRSRQEQANLEWLWGDRSATPSGRSNTQNH